MLAEVHMRIGSVLVVIWLIIGGVAAGQRGDYRQSLGSCSRASTVAVTILAGPLNYAGVNPDINCVTPQPSS
jgi:hypothetical protein